MFLFVGAVLVLRAMPAAPPTLRAVEASSPAKAGDLLLTEAHEKIVSIERVRQPGPNPPGLIELDLVEIARLKANACLRRRWRAKFGHRPGEAAADARFEGAYPVWEVALPGLAGCAGAAFAHVNPGIDVATAAAALERLRGVVARPAGAEVVCFSRFDPQLCADERTTIARLAATPAWAISGKPGAIELRLGKRSEAPITVELDDARPNRLKVGREVPAPF